MVLEVFESARRPKCQVAASLRHVRRLESARTPQKTPPSAFGAHAKRAVSRARSAAFSGWAPHLNHRPGAHRSLFRLHLNPEPQRAARQKTADLPPQKQKKRKKSPGGIELTTTRRPQQITMGSVTMGLTVPLKEPPLQQRAHRTEVTQTILQKNKHFPSKQRRTNGNFSSFSLQRTNKSIFA